VLALTAAACSPLAAGVLWIIANVLADKAADAEWRQIDRAHHLSGRNLIEALSMEVLARTEHLSRGRITRPGA